MGTLVEYTYWWYLDLIKDRNQGKFTVMDWLWLTSGRVIFLKRGTFIGIILLLTLVTAYGMYFGMNERTYIGYLIITNKLLFVEIVIATMWTIHWESNYYMPMYMYLSV